jgi:hypothetical protein
MDLEYGGLTGRVAGKIGESVMIPDLEKFSGTFGKFVVVTVLRLA